MNQIRHAVIKGIKVFTEMRWEGVLRCNHVQNVLLALGIAQICVQKMLIQVRGRILQLLHAKRANRLHNIWPNTFEWRFSFLTKWCIHLRVSFYQMIKTQNNNLSL